MEPNDYAVGFRTDLEVFDLMSERTRHGDEGGIGASSFGCREEMRRVLTRTPPSDSPDKTAALIGTYIDVGVKAARKAANPNLIVDRELPCTLRPAHGPKDGFTFPVHPDEIDPDEGDGWASVTDVKTKAGLEAIRRGLADEQYRFQRHLQGLAVVQAGLADPDRLIVRNVFLDRSGKDPDVHVEQEPFSMQVVEEATDWLDDVLYAVQHNEEASKDKPRAFCKWCPFFTDCRGGEIEVDPITDEKLAALVDAAGVADATAKREMALVEELKNMGLRGLTGYTERFQIVSKWVNSVRQQPHWRVEISERAS